jgi:hypothetical protein
MEYSNEVIDIDGIDNYVLIVKRAGDADFVELVHDMRIGKFGVCLKETHVEMGE